MAACGEPNRSAEVVLEIIHVAEVMLAPRRCFTLSNHISRVASTDDGALPMLRCPHSRAPDRLRSVVVHPYFGEISLSRRAGGVADQTMASAPLTSQFGEKYQKPQVHNNEQSCLSEPRSATNSCFSSHQRNQVQDNLRWKR